MYPPALLQTASAMSTMFLPPHQPILHLPHGVPELIQATTALPTYSAFLAQLVQNAIEAHASHISCWINPTLWSMRVTDDGQGISKEDLKGGLGCDFGMSSKYRATSGGDADDDGFLESRGRALASMGTLASLEIISRCQGFATTYHKSIKNGKTSSFIKSEKHAKSSSGTTIILKDIYHTVRVKRTVGSNSSSSSSTSTIQACKKALELAVLCYASNPLAEPFDLAITLTLEQDPFSGMPSKRLLDIKINTSDILTTFATLFGGALTESAKSFRASSHGIQVRGFISFTADGHPTRAHQYVFVNGCHLEQSNLAEVVEDMFKKYRVFDSEEEEDDDRRYGAARGDRAGGKGVGRSVKPVFLLHLTVPASETDGTSGPLKDVPVSKKNQLVRKVVSSTLKTILKSHTSKPAHSDTAPSTALISSSMAGSRLEYTESQIASPRQSLLQPDQASDFRSAVYSHTSIFTADVRCNAKKDPCRNARLEQKTGQTPEWLARALANRAQQVFPQAVSSILPASLRPAFKSKADAQEAYGRADTALDQVGMACVQFSKEDLLHATFLSQVDDKFICCLISHRDGRKTLVMIDQHAADERVRVERLLKETLQQFRATQVMSTALAELAHVIQLPLEQVEWLMARPERLDLFAKWGFRISYLTDPLVKTDNYSSLAVDSVPTLLCNRLGASGGKEVKGIIAGYIAFLQTQPDEGILALVKTLRDSAACPGLDIDGVLRWMPKRMKGLIDSKACRGAIMFNDPLTADKCKLLIKQLSQTSFPFICAHGRPSVFPIGQTPATSACTVNNDSKHYQDPIDWTEPFLD